MAQTPSSIRGDAPDGAGKRAQSKAEKLALSNLVDDEEFNECARRARASESAITRHEFHGVQVAHRKFSRIEIARSRIVGCSFVGCDFEKASFQEMEFVGCDLSNSDFSDCYMKHCRFVDCKAIGVKFTHAVWRDVIVRDSRFSGAYFDRIKMVSASFSGTDCTEASISEAELEGLDLDGSKFISNDFFKTKLKDVDFSTCDFETPLVSSPPEELRGAQVNLFQAGELASLLGLIVKN